MKPYVLIIGIIIFSSGCRDTPFKDICYTEISSIIISTRNADANSNDWQDNTITNQELIKDLFVNYLFKLRRKPIKFMSIYKIAFDYKDAHYEIFVSGSSIKMEGGSYTCKNNLGNFIRENMIQ